MSIENITVLIIEDQEDTRESVVEMLATFGITRVITAEDGRVAQEIIDGKETPISLILCDWNMPNLDGIKLLKSLNRKKRKIPFIMMTGRSDAQSVLTAKANNVVDYIGKPFTLKELKKKIIRAYEENLNYTKKINPLRSVGETHDLLREQQQEMIDEGRDVEVERQEEQPSLEEMHEELTGKKEN